MEKLQTPVVAGVSGAAILAALLSFGGSDTKKPAAAQNPPETKQSSSDNTEKGAAPNQEGPWRAVCEEYAPNDAYDWGVAQTPRGYNAFLFPPSSDGTVEVTEHDSVGRSYKIAVHKQLIGDLVSCIPTRQLSGIHLIIATVPDPDKTEMRLEFDRYVNALEKAAAIQGFDYTGYWFPWKPRETGPPPHKEDEVEAALLRAEQPGILLFHNRQMERLFIFVVGETPTSGIDRMQLVQALRYRQHLIEASQYREKRDESPNISASPPSPAGAKLNGPLMISGPHYSGTFASLAEVLQESDLLREAADRDPKDLVKIVSPDTSSEKLIGGFNELCKSTTGCSFRSLSITASQKDKVVGAYLSKLGYGSEQIAELVEDESGFGTSEVDTSEGNVGSQSTATFGLVLRFPRELSAVRSLSDRQSEHIAESGAKLLSLAKSPVPIRLAGQEPIERDRPSTYASDAEASEISNALEDDVRVIREKDIQCVVVLATNALDRIFLLEYIHDRLPNIRAVTEDADELEISHPHFVDLTGTIVISSLPTVPERAAVKGMKPSSISFASVAAEEQFLSTAILLDHEVMKRDITKADDVKDAVVNGDIRERGWTVSIAGEDGFELVRLGVKKAPEAGTGGPTLLFGEDGANAGNDAEEVRKKIEDGVALEVAEPRTTPRFFISFSIAIFLLTTLHLLRLLNSERPSYWRRILKRFGYDLDNRRLLKFAYVEPGRKWQDDFRRAFNLLALNSQLFLLNWLVLMANPVLYRFDRGPVGLRGIAFWAWVMVGCTGWAVFASLSSYRKDLGKAWGTVSASTKTSLGFFSFLMIWYLISSIAFLCCWRGDALREWQRILSFDSGLSPILPIAAILLAWALWAGLQLRRVKWIAYRKMDLRISEIAPPKGTLPKFICDDMTALHDEIDPPTIGLGRVLFVLFFVGVVASWQWRSLKGIEPYNGWGGGLSGETLAQRVLHLPQLAFRILAPPSFEWWFGFWGFVMLLMTVLLAAYQLYQMWKGLARLLRRLEPTRMKCTFEKIGKDDRIHIKLWDLGKAQLRFDEMALIIESLRRMKRLTDADVAQKALAVYQNADLAGRQPTQDDRDELNKALNACIQEALEQIEGNKEAEPKGVSGFVRSLFCGAAEPGTEFVAELDRYLALRLVTLVRYVLLQMRNLMWFVIYGYFLAVVSVTFYPFQGGKNLSDMLGVTFVIVLVIMAMLVTAVLRNPMLKRLEDSESNIASVLQASIHLLSVGGLPALALLAWQFPWIGQIAFSWLRPLLSAFR